jgi:hypothetical protein
MRPPVLRMLTWVTVAAAVASALWLAVVVSDPGLALRLTAADPTLVCVTA